MMQKNQKHLLSLKSVMMENEMACCISCKNYINTENDCGYTSFTGMESGKMYVCFIHIACIVKDEDERDLQAKDRSLACTDQVNSALAVTADTMSTPLQGNLW